MKNFLWVILFPILVFSKSPSTSTKGVLPELQLNKKSESENLKTAASVETLISKSEEKAIKQLQILVKKYKGSSQEPDLLFRLAELYARRAKTGRFVDLYRGEKTLAEILTPKLTQLGAKTYLAQAITIYQSIKDKFPKYPALDEVLFNMAFAYEQKGDADLALKNFSTIVKQFPNSPLLPETHMALGELYFMKQNYEESQKNYEKVQEWPDAPIAPVALYKSAWCSYNLKNTLEAIQKMEKLLLQSRERPLISHVRTEARRDLALFFSEVGETKNSISYFKKHLLENEIGLTILELSNIYERHGKNSEMDQVLLLFLNEYPEDTSSGKIHLRRVQYLNEGLKFDLVMDSLKSTTKLCEKDKWKKLNNETFEFCSETYPNQLRELAAEWWENWNKLKRTSDFVPKLTFIFDEYLKFENPQKWNVPIHMSYAELMFNQKNYKQATLHYEGVSLVEKLDPKILPEALYGAIVSLDRDLENNKKDQALRQHLYLALNNYIQKSPKGEFIDDAYFKKAFLFFEEKEYPQALEWLAKIKNTKKEMKEKKEDLSLEIYRSKKDFTALAQASSEIMKSSSGERFSKMKLIYQSAQQAIIQNLISEDKLEEAAKLSQSFYQEHRPEEKALEALHLSIELSEKVKQFRGAAEKSEILAKEFKTLKKDSDADKMMEHSIQLFLQLGDLTRAQKSLPMATEYALDPVKKRENLELNAEIATWFGNLESTENAWKILETFMDEKENQDFKFKQYKFFEQNAPERAKVMRDQFIQKGIEPYFSESQLSQLQKLCDEKKWSPCYQLSLKLNKDSTPPQIRAQARFLQSKVLINEFYQQSLKASPERMGMVMAYKAEKFDKAVQVLNNVSQRSEILSIRKQGVINLITLYNDYVAQLKKSMETFDTSNPDLSSLKSEIEQILPVLESRPKELESTLVELDQLEQKEIKEQKTIAVKKFPELNGFELRAYLPSWEDTIPYRPLNEIKGDEKTCLMKKIQEYSSLSSLGKEANSCLVQKKYKELEWISLKLSDLFPEAPWGPYYLSLMASQMKSPDRALWYLKLAQKRSQDAILSYEDIRQRYLHTPDSSYITEVKKLGESWANLEETQFLTAMDFLNKKKCDPAHGVLKELRTTYWKSLSLSKIYNTYCPSNSKERSVSSVEN